MFKILLGFIVGAMVATFLFVAEDYGYFEGVHDITRDDIIDAYACTRLSPESKWFVEPGAGDFAVVTLSYPFHRHKYLLDLGALSNPHDLVGRRRLIITKKKTLEVGGN